MIRKQLYIAERHEQKLRELAAEWQCSEAAVVRRAIDQLPGPEKPLSEQIRDRLREAGLLVEVPSDPSLPRDPDEHQRWRAALEARIGSRKEPLGLSEAVLEDRR